MNSRLRPIMGSAVLGVVVMTSGCVIPSVSLHSFRDVTLTLTESDSGKPVATVPFSVRYDNCPAESPIVYHLEFRTPKERRAKTDENGKVVVKLADYARTISLEIDDKERGYVADFFLSRELIRDGGVIESQPYHKNYHRLRLD